MTSTQKLLLELIAIPSVNPALLPERPDLTGEERLGAFLTDKARQTNLEVETQTVRPGRSNVVIKLQPSGPVRRRVLLAPHLDTVGGDSEDLFRPVLERGRIYGRGACDTKGSVAAMFTALLEVARAGKRPARTEVVFVGLVDEEFCQAGSRDWARTAERADLAIVGEPTRLRVGTAHKGFVWATLRTRGKSAHGARPELGRNAIQAMAEVVHFLETDYARLLARRRHRLLGSGTINVGMIAGGRQANIVPDECEIQIDRRTLPGEQEAEVLKEIKELLRSWKVEVSRSHAGVCWPLETDGRLPLVRQLLEATRQKAPSGMTYFSDAGVLGAAGTPSVLFGPGDIAQAHTAKEWISIAQLDRAQAMLARFLRALE